MHQMRKGLFAFLLTAIFVITGSLVSAQCEAEGNESEATATVIGYQEFLSGCVSSGNTTDPSEFEDPFDYYVMEIPAGDNVSGEVIFNSPVASTVLRIWSADTGIWFVSDIFTNNEVHEFTIEVPPDTLPGGRYYARVFFWSNTCYDHEYTLTIDLEAEVGTTEGPAIMLDTGKFAKVPWPIDTGNERNTARSTYAGMTGEGYRVVSTDVDVVPHNPYLPGEKSYNGLLVSNDDKVYFLESKTMSIVPYSITSGFPSMQYFQSNSTMPPCLDNQGQIYYIHGENLVNLNSYPSRPDWSEELPAGVYKNVMCVGDRIYTSVEGQRNYVQAWYTSGYRMCEVEVWGAPVGIAEVPFSKDFYVQTETHIYKFDSFGNELWVDYLFMDSKIEPGDYEVFGPIIRHDGKIWLNDARQPKWFIYGGGGILVDSDYFYGHTPVAACMRGDGTFFLAFDDQEVEQYYSSDWTDVHMRYEFDGDLVDMILDGDDTVYFCYLNGNNSAYLWKSVLDDPYLTSVHGIDTGIPANLCDPEYGVDMAIGEGGKLLFLHEKGWLSVFQGSPPWSIKPGYIILHKFEIPGLERTPPGEERTPPGLEKPKPPKGKKPPKKKGGY